MTLHSRAARIAAVGPASGREPEAFAAFVLALVRRHGIRLVIPASDASLLALDEHRAALEAETRLAMASSWAVRQVLDKRLNLDLARRLGVPCAREYELRSVDDVPEVIATLGLPVVLKHPGNPADRKVPQFAFRVLRANSERELREYLERYCDRGVYPLVQEYLGGEAHSVNCLVAQGDMLAVDGYRSIRSYAGNGVLRQSVEPPAELVGYARDLLGALRWDGVANLSFYGDAGRWRYTETNGRFWGSTQGSIDAGWDVPHSVYRYFVHGERLPAGSRRVGTVNCWHYGDLRLLIDRLRGLESPTASRSPGRLRAIGEYVGGFRVRHRSDVFRRDDGMPAVWEYYGAIRTALPLGGLRRTRRPVGAGGVTSGVRGRGGGAAVGASGVAVSRWAGAWRRRRPGSTVTLRGSRASRCRCWDLGNRVRCRTRSERRWGREVRGAGHEC
jgi:predicted ATP-grasp superfamily ATP-dependent carboligase